MSRTGRARQALAEFFATEAASGLLLLGAAAIALAWANSPWDLAYEGLRDGAHVVVNEGLMAVFFLVVGLEIKRELVGGELASPRKAALPVLAAIGGMVVPALIFTAVAGGGPAGRGWGIPIATDIAFVVGVLTLLGPRVPSSLKLFLLALAIVDDIGAVLVIAVAYSSGIDLWWLAASAGVLAAMVVLWRLGGRFLPLHVLLAFAVWAALYRSGVHATLAGVAVGLLVPVGEVGDLLERRLHPVSSYVIVPVFALVNAGVHLSGLELDGRVVGAIVAGLVIGKIVGITGASWIAVRAGLCVLPDAVRWSHLVGGAALAGVGFTVSLFVAELAYAGSEGLAKSATVGVLVASALAAALGAVVLALVGRRSARRSAS